MEILNETLVNVLSTIIIGALTLVLVQTFSYLKNKTSLIQDEQARQIVNDTLDKVEKLINTNITAVDSTSKPLIVQALADGKVTKDELNKLAEEVKNNVLNQVGTDAIQILNDSLGNVDQYIENKIESQLAILKADPNSPVTKTTIK